MDEQPTQQPADPAAEWPPKRRAALRERSRRGAAELSGRTV